MENDKLLKIIDHFGVRSQMRKLNEETYELIEAMDEYEDYAYFKCDEDNTKVPYPLMSEVISEMADVLTLLGEIIAKYNISEEEIMDNIEFKVNRTLGRIESGYYDEKDE